WRKLRNCAWKLSLSFESWVFVAVEDGRYVLWAISFVNATILSRRVSTMRMLWRALVLLEIAWIRLVCSTLWALLPLMKESTWRQRDSMNRLRSLLMNKVHSRLMAVLCVVWATWLACCIAL